MWYECHTHQYYIDIRRCGMSANETILSSKAQFVKVNPYNSKHGNQHRALVHTGKQATLSPKHDMCKTIQTGKPTVLPI